MDFTNDSVSVPPRRSKIVYGTQGNHKAVISDPTIPSIRERKSLWAFLIYLVGQSRGLEWAIFLRGPFYINIHKRPTISDRPHPYCTFEHCFFVHCRVMTAFLFLCGGDIFRPSHQIFGLSFRSIKVLILNSQS